jgi:hypothetical protein
VGSADTAASFNGSAFPNLTNGLVLHLSFDGDYNDTSGLGNNAYPGGSPTFITPGRIGVSALDVNTVAGSINYYVYVPYSANFALAPPPA